MKIQKLIHSCLLIEENGKHILIDPGSWSFGERGLKTDQIPKLEAIFITHPHGDHCNPPAIKEFISRDKCPVYCNADIATFLQEQGIAVNVITIPQTIEVGGFTVTSTECPHGDLPVPIPLNNGFWVNHRLFHPGDSHVFEKNLEKTPEILALPILAPWGTLTEAAAIALRLKPRHVIPIHDGFVKQNFHNVLAEIFAATSIQFHPLQPGEEFEV